jgi:hypothetical protein
MLLEKMSLLLRLLMTEMPLIFSEFVVQSNPQSLSEVSLKSLSTAAAAAVIISQASKIKSHISKAKMADHIELKLDALADAISALNTKSTGIGALTYIVSK